MLERLLNEIRKGGTLEASVLAARLGTSPGLVVAMLEHLQRLNLIGNYTGCATGCTGCGLQGSCATGAPIRVWQTHN